MRNILVRVYILNEIVVEMNNVIGMGKLLNMKRCRFIVGMSSKYFFFSSDAVILFFLISIQQISKEREPVQNSAVSPHILTQCRI